MTPHRVRRASRDGFFHYRILAALALCSAGLFLGLLGATASNISNVSRVSPESAVATKMSQWALDHTINGQQAEFIVMLSDQADLKEARSLRIKQERRRQVRDALWNRAQQTQQPILNWLRQHNIEHRAFYIVNAIWVKTDGATIAIIAARPDVLRVEGNPQVRNRIIDPTLNGLSPSTPEITEAIESGILFSHAPQVWSLGYTGQGIVVGGADTGYRWTHNALKNHYRGWDGVAANHNYNWHDSIHSNGGAACGHDSIVPCDDTDHGTHTMGTAVGSDGGTNQIGMAPGAKWIGCRNMDRGVGTPARYIECMEFFLAPYPIGGSPAQGNPDLAPDITTNSWGCPASEGCAANTLKAAVEAQRAAGIFMVVSAGNDGPNCHSISDPPAIYDAVYTVGALNTGSDGIADFSSRGTVTSDNSSRLKPDISAPGNPVRSAVRATNSSYASFSGTSMASPHVAGAAALLWSAVPELRRDIDRTEAILNASAMPIGSFSGCDNGTVPNNTYGNGRLDAKAAVDCAYLEIMPSRVVPNGQAMNITFYAGANLIYRLEYKNSPADSEWLQVPAASDVYPSADGETQAIDPYGAQETRRIYRVRISR